MKIEIGYENSQVIVKAAGVTGILWGLLVPFLPKILELLLGNDESSLVLMLQCAGGGAAILGAALIYSSYDPARNWPSIASSFFMNFFLALYFTYLMAIGLLPLYLGLFLIFISAIWLFPFFLILQNAYDENTKEESAPKRFGDLIKFAKTNHGKTLLELSEENKVLLVFIRHFGCTFCRETVFELAKLDKAILDKKLTLVYVHMSDPSFGDDFFARYYEYPVNHLSDPARKLYQSLNLERGSLSQLFGFKVWLRGIWAGIFKGHGIGHFEGDILQLGGIFIISKGQILFEKKAVSASEVFDINLLLKI